MKRTFLLTGLIGLGLVLNSTGADAKNREGPRDPAILFEQLDTDGDGRITAAEFDAHRGARFAQADVDGDGLLSAEELTAQAENQRGERMQRRATRMIERLDTDGDGLLSSEEMQARRGEGRNPIDRLDADGDGALSQEEFAEMRGGRHGGGKPMHGGERGEMRGDN